MLTENQLLEFKMRLKDRFCDVREEIRLELLRSDDQHFIDLAGQVHDLEDESVADLLVDLNLAIIDMHVQENAPVVAFNPHSSHRCQVSPLQR